jgi:hypothetical protein
MTWRLCLCQPGHGTDEHRDVLPALTKVMQAISQLPVRLLKKPMVVVKESD